MLFPKSEQDVLEEISGGDTKLWTLSYFKCALFLWLSSIKQTYIENGLEIIVRKYYKIAQDLIYLIPVTMPVSAFPIYIPDLPLNIIDVIRSKKNTKVMKEIILDAVGNIFDNIDYAYSQCSVRKCLKVILCK